MYKFSGDLENVIFKHTFFIDINSSRSIVQNTQITHQFQSHSITLLTEVSGRQEEPL
jgi:hypothetical protein